MGDMQPRPTLPYKKGKWWVASLFTYVGMHFPRTKTSSDSLHISAMQGFAQKRFRLSPCQYGRTPLRAQDHPFVAMHRWFLDMHNQ